MFKTNIRRHTPSRRAPKAGDMFAFSIDSKGWLFGRVVRTDASVSGSKDEILVYIYDVCQSHPKPIPVLDKTRLLIPPLATNQWPWKLGWFVTIKTGPPEDGDVFARHCFTSGPRRFIDEFGRPVHKRFDPCGFIGLYSMKGIDNHVSEVLGLPVIPEGEMEPPTTGVKRRPRRGKCTVTVRIPLRDKATDLEDIEEQLRLAVESSGKGEWDGHGIGLQSNEFEVVFASAAPAGLLAALEKAATQLRERFPKGCRVIIRYESDGETEEVQLT